MKNLETKLEQYFQGQPEVVAVYLFGSEAKGKANHQSDIDVAVLVRKISRDRSFDISLKYSCDLMKFLCANKVDVVVLNTANTIVKNQVFKYGKIILDRDSAFTRKFRDRSIIEYLDFLPTRRESEKKMKEKIMKEKDHG